MTAIIALYLALQVPVALCVGQWIRRGQTQFWRKRKDINKGECRFCSRACYAASLKGVCRALPRLAIERGIAAAAKARRAQTQCKRDHPLSGENLFITQQGSRGCKECRKIHKQTYRSKTSG